MAEVKRMPNELYSSSNPGNGHRGPVTLDLGIGYSADTYYKTSYVAELPYLAEITEELVVKANLWPREVAQERIATIIGQTDPQKTSWIGFRKSDAPRGQYEGAAWQDILKIPTFRRDSRLLFMRLRVFIPEAQRKHMGRTAMPLSLNTHSEDEPTHMGHRTGSPAAGYAWLEAPVFRPGRRSPYDRSYNKDTTALMLMIGVYELTHIHGRFPNLSTGVSIGEFSGPNMAYIPDPNHAPTMKIYKWMVEKLKMNFERGDVLTQIGELK